MFKVRSKFELNLDPETQTKYFYCIKKDKV